MQIVAGTIPGNGFFRNIRILAAHAERLGMIIGLENPGNGEDNLFNVAEDGLKLLEQIDSPACG